MIITTDNQDQGWLDHFNSLAGYEFKMNEKIEVTDSLIENVEKFNHEIACGPAIRIQEGVTE